MDYNEAIDFLQDLCKFGINLGLGRIEKLLALLDNPQQKIKTIHVAGTNGKGSTIAILASILIQAGYKVGVYTSPHLDSYRERFRINGREIANEDFGALMEDIKGLMDQVLRNTGQYPTEFEVLTAMALEYFYRQKVDIAIMEVGMGGRLDSTNVVVPEVAIITPISYDHVAFLGPTLVDIAKEKAGIIKNKVPVVVGEQDQSVLETIKERAQLLEAPLIEVGRESYQQLEHSTVGQKFDLKTANNYYHGLTLGLLGDYQLQNAATALEAIEVLETKGFIIPKVAITRGLAEAKWPGRLEFLATNPPILLDGAHNSQGAQGLAQALDKYFSFKKLVLVLAILDDKDKEDIVKWLAPMGDIIILTKVPNNPRNNGWQSLVEILPSDKEVVLVENAKEAVDRARIIATEEDLIVITGSLYLIGAIRGYVLNSLDTA